jgi:hypothetical protein
LVDIGTHLDHAAVVVARAKDDKAGGRETRAGQRDSVRFSRALPADRQGAVPALAPGSSELVRFPTSLVGKAVVLVDPGLPAPTRQRDS